MKAAEQGYITQLAWKMPQCFCPEELGGATYFEPVTAESTEWMPTHEDFPLSKREGGHRQVDNAVRDLERIKKAREEPIRRNNEEP
jgi:hypothetical protein